MESSIIVNNEKTSRGYAVSIRKEGAIMAKNPSGLSQPTYDYIKEMIMSRQLMPGDRIPEQKIAQEFGISRTPVRDAMRQLANEGLIEIFPNRFAKVAEYGPEDVKDIGILRISLDLIAIKLAALYGSQADFLRLRQIGQSIIDAHKAGEVAKRMEYDSDFHLELARISGNLLLLKFQTELYMRVQFIMLHHPNPVENEKRHLQQHLEISEALADNDVEKATALIIDHLASFYNLREKYPADFFNTVPFAVK